ncbi:MAG: tetratricopeptide repeat protein, partial [Burkholderiales bacterium]
MRDKGDLESAAALISPYAEGEADDPEASLLLADIERARGDGAAAERRVRAVVAAHPDKVDALMMLGTVLRDAGDLRGAMDVYLKVLSLAPEDLGPRIDLALVLIALDQAHDATILLQYVLNRDPDSAEAHCNRGIALRRLSRMPEAFEHFRRAVEIRPGEVAFRNNFGLALRELDRLDEAEAELRCALELAPEDARSRNNLASVLRELGRPEEAREALLPLIRPEQPSGEVWGTWGAVLQDLGDVTGARAAFDRSVALEPQSAELRLSRAFHILYTGDFERGWPEYDARLDAVDSPRRGFAFPEWEGGAFAGRSVLVYSEQGYGDELMFASCFPDLIAEASGVTIECDPRLRALFARSFPKTAVVSGETRGEHGWLAGIGKIDVQVAAGSLPRRYRPSMASFPARPCYLIADPERVERYRARLGALGTGPKIGLSWRGGLARTRRAVRSLAPADLQTMLARPDAHFVSLQHAPAETDLAELAELAPGRFHHWPDALADADESAALMRGLDCTITVCSSVVHLGGALGLDVRVLVPANPEWRYLHAGHGMPWYPSVRLHRRLPGADWSA